MHEMLSPVTRGQKSLIRTAECLEFFKHPFEMRDDAKRPHFYVNPGQDTATGVLLPGRDCGAGPGPQGRCRAAGCGCPEQLGLRRYTQDKCRACPPICREEGHGRKKIKFGRKEEKGKYLFV